jgi:peptide/nickel transport system substrate-binding protein
MKSIASRSLVLISAFLTLQAVVKASTPPRYGGTLKVELRATSVSLDPREWKAGTAEFATNEKMGALVFDRLVALDNYGRFQPQLAVEWSHDAAFKRWQFILRANVKFSDGTALSAGDVAAALEPLLPNGQQISASANTVVIQSVAGIPDLLEELASGRFFVYRVQADGTLMGTGPFFVATSSQGGARSADSAVAPGKSATAPQGSGAAGVTHLHFRANEETWSGRPFVDAIDVTLGVPSLRQLFDLQLGKADLVELSPDLVRRAMQENLRFWSSAPVLLYGLRFSEGQPSPTKAELREAIALSLDRQTMANVLLQKQAEPASALLPQWLSGYAFLFNMETNPERAKEIRATLPGGAATGAEPLHLRVDPPGDLAKLLGERVVVNARQAAISLQVVSRTPLHSGSNTTASSSEPAASMHLFAWHYASLSPRVELESMVTTLNFGDSREAAVSSTDPEQLYAREKKLLEERRVLPLVALPEYAGLGQNVRDWMPARWGEWHLADVWLDLPVSGEAAGSDANSERMPVIHMPAKPMGAKP